MYFVIFLLHPTSTSFARRLWLLSHQVVHRVCLPLIFRFVAVCLVMAAATPACVLTQIHEMQSTDDKLSTEEKRQTVKRIIEEASDELFEQFVATICRSFVSNALHKHTSPPPPSPDFGALSPPASPPRVLPSLSTYASPAPFTWPPARSVLLSALPSFLIAFFPASALFFSLSALSLFHHVLSHPISTPTRTPRRFFRFSFPH